jgi:hypothetical protein
MCKEESTRPSLRTSLTNLKGPQPWTQKIRLLLRNNRIKLTTLQNCCGHPGEPGC